MKRIHWLVLVGFLSGCSTHPVVDILDYFKPGKLGPNKVQPYGGVGVPQGAIVPVAPSITVGPPAVVPGVGVVPPPAPLPGNVPPGDLQLQPPLPPPPPNR
jgi:hypothetical protein